MNSDHLSRLQRGWQWQNTRHTTQVSRKKTGPILLLLASMHACRIIRYGGRRYPCKARRKPLVLSASEERLAVRRHGFCYRCGEHCFPSTLSRHRCCRFIRIESLRLLRFFPSPMLHPAGVLCISFPADLAGQVCDTPVAAMFPHATLSGH